MCLRYNPGALSVCARRHFSTIRTQGAAGNGVGNSNPRSTFCEAAGSRPISFRRTLPGMQEMKRGEPWPRGATQSLLAAVMERFTT